MPRILASAPLESMSEYLAFGGGAGLLGARYIGPEATIAEIDAAGLRGRGGAGFPTARKWRSIVDGGAGTRYVVLNGAEGEPGTFKDRALMRANPYAVLEGLLIAAEVVGAEHAFVALKASFETELATMSRALGEAADKGWLGELSVQIVTGPEEYLFGEEKALLEVIEGNEPLPRWLPPYLHGLYSTAPQLGWQAHEPADYDDDEPADGARVSNPTLVNNAETLAHVSWVLAHGADEFRSIGTDQSPGSLLCTVVGDVLAPKVCEVPMGTPLRSVIEGAGGVAKGRTVKAVFSGVANAVLDADALDTLLTYEHMAAAGSGLGAAGFIVYDNTACMVEVAHVLSRFLSVESCGQCPPCKLGSGEITAALARIRTGTGMEGDLDIIERSLLFVTDANRCYLPVQEQAIVSSILRSFPEDFADHLERWCPSKRTDYPTPKITELADGGVAYDPRQERKRPDWTYES